MSEKKIKDEAEVRRWFMRGETYAWMQAEYKRKYGVEISASAFTNLRRAKGWSRRQARDTSLIPWAVAPRHRHKYPVLMLRAESRVRAGLPINDELDNRLTNFKKRLQSENLVVAYDPDSDEGFTLVKPRKRDTDLIRVPDEVTSERTNSDG